MSLKIIYGKSGSGKSTYVFNEIANKIQNSTSRKIYIITPEQFSFTAEKKLLDAVSTSAVISAEVLTFNRMAYRVMKEIRKFKNEKFIITRQINAYIQHSFRTKKQFKIYRQIF